MAAMEGHAVIVRYLVQKGANVSITNNVCDMHNISTILWLIYISLIVKEYS